VSRSNTYHWAEADGHLRGRLMQAGQAIAETRIYLTEEAHVEPKDIDREIAIINRKNPGHPIRFAVVDFLQLMEGTADNRNNALEKCLREIKLSARKRGYHAAVLSQLSRKAEDDWELGKQPSLATIRDTGGAEQASDIVAFLWPDRDDYRAAQENTNRTTIKTTIWVRKQRNGSTGQCSLEFIRHHVRFREQQELDQKGLYE